MAMTEGRVFRLLRIYPADDVEFARHADNVLRSIGESAGPAALERKLRARYPAAKVQLQDRLGMNGETRPHWYVYRDGRYVIAGLPPEPSRAGEASQRG